MARRNDQTKRNKGGNDQAVDALTALLAEIEETDCGPRKIIWSRDEIEVVKACRKRGLTRGQTLDFVNRVDGSPGRTLVALRNKIADLAQRGEI